MRMPDVQNVEQLFRGYETLKVGGHECVIVHAEQRISKKGKEMLVVHLDTAPTDSQPNFYRKRFESDTRENKFWGCILYFVNDELKVNKERIAVFIKAVCNANGMNYDDLQQPQWNIIDKLILGKKVCVVFREEEYEKDNGEIGVSIKPYAFKPIEYLKEGKIKAPEKKTLKKNSSSNNIFGSDITPVNDEKMPF